MVSEMSLSSSNTEHETTESLERSATDQAAFWMCGRVLLTELSPSDLRES